MSEIMMMEAPVAAFCDHKGGMMQIKCIDPCETTPALWRQSTGRAGWIHDGLPPSPLPQKSPHYQAPAK
jgi:hypothetical protein